MNVCKQVFYSGRVQGVGFRYSVKQIASGYEVTGWVRNLDDGRVEMQTCGETGEVDSFLGAIASSHLSAHIKETDASEIDQPAVGAKGFEIRR